MSGTKCAESEGHVAAAMVGLYAAFAEVNAKKATAALVASGLWHDEHTIRSCPKCFRGAGHTDPWEGAGPLEPGSYYFHDWRDYQLDPRAKKEALRRKNDARRKRLERNFALQDMIMARDRNLCRYCGVLTTWGDDDAPWKTAGSWDHVDPFGDNSFENVVQACKHCNLKVKKQRTLEQAGMVLLDPGTTAADLTRPSVDASTDIGDVSDGCLADRPRVARDSGRGEDMGRDVLGTVPGRAGVGLGLVGGGAGLAGLVRPGAGGGA